MMRDGEFNLRLLKHANLTIEAGPCGAPRRFVKTRERCEEACGLLNTRGPEECAWVPEFLLPSQAFGYPKAGDEDSLPDGLSVYDAFTVSLGGQCVLGNVGRNFFVHITN